MLMRQVHLSQGTRRLTCWVKDGPSIRRGTRLTLKKEGLEGVWTIEHTYDVAMLDSINRDWKVGGLSS